MEQKEKKKDVAAQADTGLSFISILHFYTKRSVCTAIPF
jgi:hypothetical protein